MGGRPEDEAAGDDMSSRQDRQRAVVTGASSGIGRAVALDLATHGFDVLVHCRKRVADANHVADQIRAAGGEAAVAVADLGDAAQCEQLVRHCWESWGPIHAWVHCAGADILTGPTRKDSFERKLELLWEVDVRGTILCCRVVGDFMRQHGGGVIVTIGWDQAETGMEGDSGQLFAATKGAVMCFTKSLAVELAPTVRVNCVAPGWIRTAWGEQAPERWQRRVLSETPMKRWGTPEDVAAVVRFLCSDEASFLTGQTIRVNGGAVRA